jgi:hypothetical protein
MQKKGLVIIAVFVALIGGAIFFLLPLLSSKDLSKYVPKNAVLAMKLNLAQLGSKIDIKEIQEYKFFKKELMGGLKSSEREMIEGIMESPLKSGIQFRTAPMFAMFEHASNEPVAVFMFGIADAKNFGEFVDNLPGDLKVKDPSSDEFYEVLFDDGSSDQVKMYFNNDVAMLFVDLLSKDITLKRVRDNLINLDKDNSILSNEQFTALSLQSNDLMAFVNKKELRKFVNNFNSSESSDVGSESITYFPTGMMLNFNTDAISFKSINLDKGGNFNILRESGISPSDLKNIAAGGNPLAVMTLNIDPKKMIDAIVEVAELNNPSFKQEFFEAADTVASNLNTDRESLFKLFNGKMSIAFSGIVEQNKIDFFSGEESLKKFPKVYFWAKLDNQELADSILSKLAESPEIKEVEGVYVLNQGRYYDPTVYVAKKGDDFFVSTDLVGINERMTNNNWKDLSGETVKNLATSKPAAGFVDLNYKRYQDIVETSVGNSELELFNKLKKNVFSSFKNINISSTGNESELVLQMNEENKNSAQRLISIIENVYKISN